MSVRTLNRTLAAEGTTYRALLGQLPTRSLASLQCGGDFVEGEVAHIVQQEGRPLER